MTSPATASAEARPDPRRVWAYHGYRDNSALIAEPHALVAVGYDGSRHELPVGGAAEPSGTATHVVFTITSHVGARGSVWREPRILVADHRGRVLLSMRADAYRPDDVHRVASQAGLGFSERRYLSAEERAAALPDAPGAVHLDVAARGFKVALVSGLVVLTFLVLAALVAVFASL